MRERVDAVSVCVVAAVTCAPNSQGVRGGVVLWDIMLFRTYIYIRAMNAVEIR